MGSEDIGVIMSSTETTQQAFSLKTFLRNLLLAAGSLRITVFLLVLALVLVLIATLQQTRKDIYQVKKQHFSTPVVFIEFQELLAPAWFPEAQTVGGGFLMPSGSAVMFLMLLNLLCAHSTRFRVQATGKRLVAGLVLLVAGVATTLLVVSNGNAAGEFQEDPWIDWKTQWTGLQVLLGVAAFAGMTGVFFLNSSVRRTFSFLAGVVLSGLLAFLLYKGQDAFIGEDAMRVIWRLLQGSVAAIVCYLGALLVFKRRAGVVVIHAGLLLLMVGELYTTFTAVEQRMFFHEGESSSHTFNVDEVEMAVISKTANGKENVVAIPSKRLAVDGVLDVPQLPFTIKTLDYFTNCKLFRGTVEGAAEAGFRGLSLRYSAEPVAPAAGVSGDEINMAAAYVSLFSRDGDKNLGTFLISQSLYQDDSLDLDSITVDGTEYQIALRFKHYYKNYTVQLNTTTRSDYVGTNVPKTYASNFRIIDPDHAVDEVKDVSMNKPLRYNNETFYQAGHDTNPKTGERWSVLQVVRNSGWMIPYVSCAMVGIGLMLHFMGIFIRFVEKLTRDHKALQKYDMVSWGMVIGFGLLSLMSVYRLVPDPVVHNDFDLQEFGKIPVAFGGRVQPLDSVARSTLRQLRIYEQAAKWDDKQGEQVNIEAIRWLADWVFDSPGCKDYRIFKIVDKDVISGLSLVTRKRFLYSVNEIENAQEELDKYVATARTVASKDEASLTVFQKRILELDSNLTMVRSLRYALSSPEAFGFENPIDALQIVMNIDRRINIPMAIPGEAENDWSAISPTMTGQWIKKLSQQYGLDSPDDLSERLVREHSTDVIRDIVVRREMAVSIMIAAGIEPGQIEVGRLNEMITDMMEDDDPEIQDRIARIQQSLAPKIEATTEARIVEMAELVADEMANHVHVSAGKFDFTKMQTPVAAVMHDAWQNGDAAKFNQAVSQHLETTASAVDVKSNQGRLDAEQFLSRLSPFYISTSLYIVAFILLLFSWLMLTGVMSSQRMASWSLAGGRAAFWVIVIGFLIHSLGLYLRIYVSGRPPVTNLYGSAVFIGWCGVLFGIATERMLGYGFGSFMSSLIGVATLFTAFALGAEGDTFSVLQAVLDTQFWLSTHVVSITIGYAGTLCAGFLGIVYIIVSMFLPIEIKTIRSLLGKMIYGVTCMSLIFSFVGTVLGGLWADDSWGRFWGWDPKENGAMMIVLVNSILLHARWSGLARDRGIACIAILGNIVTLWSWFAVNELGIGLHSYAITEGRMATVGIAWLTHLFFILAAALPMKWWLSERAERAARNVAANSKDED